MSEPWAFALLALAAWRTWKLIGDDVISERPRVWLLYKLRRGANERWDYWAAFLGCSYCLGSWCALSWWASWMLWPDATELAATPLAISAVVGLIGTAWSALSD